MDYNNFPGLAGFDITDVNFKVLGICTSADNFGDYIYVVLFY